MQSADLSVTKTADNGTPNEAATVTYTVTELMGGGDMEGVTEDATDHRLSLERAIEIAETTNIELTRKNLRLQITTPSQPSTSSASSTF